MKAKNREKREWKWWRISENWTFSDWSWRKNEKFFS